MIVVERQSESFNVDHAAESNLLTVGHKPWHAYPGGHSDTLSFHVSVLVLYSVANLQFTMASHPILTKHMDYASLTMASLD